MSTPSAVVAPARVEQIKLELIHPDPNQVRREFHVDQLTELAGTIKAKGVIQPVVVVPNGNGFRLVAGERRWRASKLAGRTDIPAVVREDLKPEDIPALQLVENLQREGLSLAEVSAGVTELCKKHSHDEVGDMLGKSKSWVSKRVLVSEAPPAVKELVGKGKIEDAEIATGLGELLSIDKTAGAKFAKRIEKPESWQGPVTRDEVREAIRDAKHRSKIRAEAAKSAAKTRKSGKGKEDAEKAAREAERQKKRQAHAEALNKGAESFIGSAVDALHAALGVKKGRDRWNNPIRIHGAHYHAYGYGSGSLPEDLEDAKFNTHFDGDLQLFKKVSAAIGAPLKLSVSLPDLTVDQAEKVVTALRGVEIELGCEVERTGKQLANLVQRLTPGQKPFAVPSVKTPAPAPAAGAKTKPAAKK